MPPALYSKGGTMILKTKNKLLDIDKIVAIEDTDDGINILFGTFVMQLHGTEAKSVKKAFMQHVKSYLYDENLERIRGGYKS